MVSFRRPVVAGLVGAVMVSATAFAAPMGPTEQIRADITALYAALSEHTEQASDVLDRMFDWRRMAQRALQDHWALRTEQERDEFTRLFASLFRRAYVSRAHVIDASTFSYFGDRRNGQARGDGRVTVATSVQTKRRSSVAIDYVVRWNGERWRVEDILVERISLVDNYRTQFDTVVARSSYVALVEKLRAAAR
jgi:phospholipid transport system substrate-binding protein